MAKKNTSHNSEQPEELRLFKELEPYIDTIASVEIKQGSFYSLCLRASLVKCFHFNLIAWDDKNTKTSFFWLPSLRGICEDVIVLKYILRMSAKEREGLITGLMGIELHERRVTQSNFFSQHRTSQPVLGPILDATRVIALEDRVRSFWKNHGWAGMNKKTMPPVREMALKDGGHTLHTLYDYLYRLTSGTVHFNVHGLLRTGWGELPEARFSPENFAPYYASFGRIYGAYLFCCYFKMFSRFLRPGDRNKKLIDKIQKAIESSSRWPEMVTFEEMNLTVPNFDLLDGIDKIVKLLSRKELQDFLKFFLLRREEKKNLNVEERKKAIRVLTGRDRRVGRKLRSLSDETIKTLHEKIVKNEIESLLKALSAKDTVRFLAQFPGAEVLGEIKKYIELDGSHDFSNNL